MNKKMTLKEAGEKAIDFSREQEKEVFMNFKQPIVPKENPILTYSFTKDGNKLIHFFCPVCKEEWETDASRYYSYHECPKCGNHTHRGVYTTQFTGANTFRDNCNDYVVILDMDIPKGYVLFGRFNARFKYIVSKTVNMQECLNKENFDFMCGQWEFDPSSISSEKFVFLVDKGLRTLGSRGSARTLSNANSDHVRSLAYELKHNTFVNGGEEKLKDFFAFHKIPNATGTLTDVANRHEAIMNESAEKSRRRPKKTPEKSKYITYELKEIPESTIHAVLSEMDPLFYLRDEFGDKLTYDMICPSCRSVVPINAKHLDYGRVEIETDKCPACGRKITYNNRHYSPCPSIAKRFIYFELCEDECLVQRELVLTLSFTEERKVGTSVKETDRIFYTADGPVHCTRLPDETWTQIKKNSRHEKTCITTTGYVIPQSDKEIISLIKESVLKYSGVIAAWGLDGRKALESPGTRGEESYIYAWYKNSCIEKFLLADLYEITSEAKRGLYASDIKSNEKSVIKILGVKQPVFDIARKKDFSFNELNICQKLWELDNTLNEDKFDDIKALDCNLTLIIDMAKEYKISLTSIKEYLNSCYGYQCIKRSEALTLWRDYLRMAKSLKYNLKDKTKKFPDSLKKEHDRATFAYDAVKQEIIREQFQEKIKENKNYEYSKNKKFIVRLPEAPEDIVSEGKNLHHCVASYVNSVTEGRTVIAFIRRKDEPDNSFFTMEIRDGSIIQVKGLSNIKPTEKDLVKFIHEFAETKSLGIARGIF